jgi:uncharacterized membrane protein HdeD (DUF308 family)
MLPLAKKPTWSLLLRGAIAIVVGLFALFSPNMTLSILVVLIGAYIFANGLLAIVFSLYGRQYEDPSWWFYLTEGIIGMLIGFVIFIWPAITSLILLYAIATWAILSGIIQIITYIRLQRIFEREILLLAGGLLSIIIGLIFFRFPLGGIVTITWIIGLYAVIFGILTMISAFQSQKTFP